MGIKFSNQSFAVNDTAEGFVQKAKTLISAYHQIIIARNRYPFHAAERSESNEVSHHHNRFD